MIRLAYILIEMANFVHILLDKTIALSILDKNKQYAKKKNVPLFLPA